MGPLFEPLVFRSGLRARNRVDVIALYFGVVRLGAVLVPLNWRLAAPELARVIGDAGPRIIVGEGRHRALAVALA